MALLWVPCRSSALYPCWPMAHAADDQHHSSSEHSLDLKTGRDRWWKFPGLHSLLLCFCTAQEHQESCLGDQQVLHLPVSIPGPEPMLVLGMLSASGQSLQKAEYPNASREHSWSWSVYFKPCFCLYPFFLISYFSSKVLLGGRASALPQSNSSLIPLFRALLAW